MQKSVRFVYNLKLQTVRQKLKMRIPQFRNQSRDCNHYWPNLLTYSDNFVGDRFQISKVHVITFYVSSTWSQRINVANGWTHRQLQLYSHFKKALQQNSAAPAEA